MEAYQIALSPALGMSPADFVAAWNEQAEAYTNGTARLAETTSKGYLDPFTMTIVINIVTGIAASAIYDLVKKVVANQDAHHTHTHVEELNQPDGTRVLIVDIDEQ
jgi:hypothetical protein